MYSFVINNESCSYIRIEYESGLTEDVEVDGLPFVYSTEEIPVYYDFLDADKNIIQ